MTTEDAFAYSTFARVSLGTNDIDFRARPHSAEEADFLAAHVVLTGPDGGAVTYADLESAKTVVLVGFEPEDEAGAIFLRLRKASREGTRVLAIAPFSTRGLRKMSGTLVPTAPGDEPGALEAMVGHADYGIDATAVILAGERLATVPGALSAAAALAQKSGAKLAWVPRRAGDRGAIEAGCLPHLLPGGRPVADAAARVDAAASWGVDTLPETPGRDGDAIVAALAAGEIGGLVIGGVDPADTADPEATRAAIEAAGFVVALELRETEVTRAADVVFPVAPATDKAGTFVNWEGRTASVRDGARQPRVAARPPGPRRDLRGARRARPGQAAGLPHRRRGPRRDGRDGAVGRRQGPDGGGSSAGAPSSRPPTGSRLVRPGSRCSTTGRCRTATSTWPPPPVPRSRASRPRCTTPSARR